MRAWKRERIPVGSALPEREREVLILVGKGFTDKEIGRLLGISTYTVSDHLQRVFRRLDVDTRIEAAVWAAKQGWL